jgi:hypothetical protein
VVNNLLIGKSLVSFIFVFLGNPLVSSLFLYVPGGQESWFQACSSPLPSFTLAIGIGFWKSVDITLSQCGESER